MDLTTIQSVWSKMNSWVSNLPKEWSIPDAVSNPPEIGMCKLWMDNNERFMGRKADDRRVSPIKPCIAKQLEISVVFDSLIPAEARQGSANSYILPIYSPKFVITGNFEGTEYWQVYDGLKKKWNDEPGEVMIQCKYRLTFTSANLEFLANWKADSLTIDAVEITGNSKLEYYNTRSLGGGMQVYLNTWLDQGVYNAGQKILYDINFTAGGLKTELRKRLNTEIGK